MRVEPCTPEYLAALQMPAAMDVDTRSNVLGDPKAEAWLRDYAWALLAPEPIAVIGVQPMWKGRGYAFAMLSEVAVKSYGLSVTRTTLHALRYAETQLGMRRIEAAVRRGDERCEQWIRRLGFSFEGVMHRFGPGAVGDYGLWARLS